MAPQDVAVAVAVEISGSPDLPGVRHGAEVMIRDRRRTTTMPPQDVVEHRDIAGIPDRGHDILVAGIVVDDEGDATIVQHCGGAVPGNPVMHRELGSHHVPGRVETLPAHHVGEIVIPGDEESTVGERDDVRLGLRSRLGRVDEKIGANVVATVVEQRCANAGTARIPAFLSPHNDKSAVSERGDVGIGFRREGASAWDML